MTSGSDERGEAERFAEEQLWDPARLLAEITSGRLHAVLSPAARAELAALGETELVAGVRTALCRPQPAKMPASQVVRRTAHAAQYLALFERLALPRALAVYEPCVGGSYPVVLAVAAYGNDRAEYATVNLNRQLAAELQAHIGHLRLRLRLVEDDAANAARHLPAGAFDAACFHHAVNDILQTAVAEPRGMDTAKVEWWSHERQMIEWLAEDHAAGRLEEHGRPEFLAIVRAAASLVRPGGYLVFDHWTWLGHRELDWFPYELFTELILLARGWIAASGLPLDEVRLPGVEPRWWMVLRVRG